MASHETSSYDRQPIDETRTVSDLVPITPDEFDDAITEVKPVVSGTVVLPEEHDDNLADAVTNVLSDVGWVPRVTAVDLMSVAEEHGEQRVTGEFTVTMHFAASDVEDTIEDGEMAVTAATTDSSVFHDVTDVDLRMPPYRMRAY